MAAQLIREYIYLYGAVSPRRLLHLSDHADFEYGLLPGLSQRLGAQVRPAEHPSGSRRRPNHRCGDLAVPGNIKLLYLPPYPPELNPKENLWDEIREKIFKNYALKSIGAVRAKLKQAILYIERNPTLVRSITSFPYIVNSL